MKKSIGLLLMAAAAYGAYRYSKMSPREKSDLKKSGRDFLNNKLGVSNLFGKKQTATS